jgi:GxxExxY protein
MNKLIYKSESYGIIGACFEVYNILGPGFLEQVYQEALHREFLLRGIPHYEQHLIEVFYKGESLEKKYKADFLCHEKILVEIKAKSLLDDIDRSIILNYLRASRIQLGFLVNFCEETLRYERYVLTSHHY